MLLGVIRGLSLIISILLCVKTSAWWFVCFYAASFLGLVVVAALVMALAAALVDTRKPQLHDSRFYRGMLNLYLDAIMYLARVHVQTEGLEKLPENGRFLLVCNHLNDIDPAVILAYCKKCQLAFISKRENMRLPIVGKFMHKLMCQMINRENDREALKTIVNCIRLIKEDEVSIAVFPEGYTSKDGKLHPFRAGTLKIAQKANVPIVVCTLNGTRGFFHNLKRLRRTDVAFHVLGVMDAEHVKAANTVELGKEIYEMMIADLGEAMRADA